MVSNIDWESRYIELEKQMKDMMRMTFDLVEKAEINSQKASITSVTHSEIDDILEITVISSSNNPFYTFEIIDDETRETIKQKTDIRKNSFKFNISNLNNFRVKVHVRNDNDEEYTDVRLTKVFNKTMQPEEDYE